MSTFRSIHQFHSGTTPGDAVTQQMFALRSALIGMGFASEIYAEHIPPSLAGDVTHIYEYRPQNTDLLIVHHSMGHTSFEHLLGLDVSMVTVFHSITPAEFFDDATMRHYVRLGFQQLRVLATRSLCGIADSNHNRQQMYDAGFASVTVVPVCTDFSQARDARAHRQEDSRNWLFVGRIVENKRQVDVVRAFAAYQRTFDTAARLTLIGDRTVEEYAALVEFEARRLGVGHAVDVVGKVSSERLWDAYANAGVFVCLSEHEGFGVPVLEAMGAGVPVIARAAAAIPETMGGAGILLEDPDPWTVAAIAHLLHADDGLRHRLVAHQDQRLARIEHFDVVAALRSVIDEASAAGRSTSVQIQGPFETTYSLAILNRNLAERLSEDTRHDVSIFATEGPGDYEPSPADLALHPHAALLYQRSSSTPFPDVVIRQMYPPRVDDSPGGITLQYFGWEESRLPAEYVRDFNAHLDGIGAMSTYVCELLAASGVVVPCEAVGVGVETPDPATTIDAPELADLKAFRFLHISSAFPRKGVDLLLDAYYATFSGADDVSLILKTYPNPHNQVGTMIEQHRAMHSDPPDVRWIDRDVSRGELDALYGLASCLVHPARGEGFGMPVAEAMLAGVPVISVAATGLADFVSDRTAATVAFEPMPAQTHLSVAGSEWMEPNVDDLAHHMRMAADGEDAALRDARVVAARRLVAERYSWSSVAARWAAFIDECRSRRPGPKVAMVTTWNARCGIAEYSRSMSDGFRSHVDMEVYADLGATPIDERLEEAVFRVWPHRIESDAVELVTALDRSTADLVHVQYQFGFFGLHGLRRVIVEQSTRRPVVVTLHRTADLVHHGTVISLAEVADELQLAGRVIVHQEADRALLEGFGVFENVEVIPIGCRVPYGLDRDEMRGKHQVPGDAFVIGTYGFLLPHKGTLHLITALHGLRKRGVDAHLVAVCALHPDPSSTVYRQQCEAEIRRLGLSNNVHLITEYLDESTSHGLVSCADVVVLPYSPTSESSSAALREVLPAGRAVVVTDLPIFADARDCVRTVASPVDGDDLIEVLAQLTDPTERQRLAGLATEFCTTNSWQRSAARHRAVYDQLIRASHHRKRLER